MLKIGRVEMEDGKARGIMRWRVRTFRLVKESHQVLFSFILPNQEPLPLWSAENMLKIKNKRQSKNHQKVDVGNPKQAFLHI